LKNQPVVLNVAGPRESKNPGIYRTSFDLLLRVLQPQAHNPEPTGRVDK
jgi:hypothetical protein